MAAFRIFIIGSLISYNTECLLIFEHILVIDCHQDGIFKNPDAWILAWIILSVASCLGFILIFYTAEKHRLLRFCGNKVTNIKCKGSFVSFTVLSLLTMAYYIWQFIRTETGLNKSIIFFAIIWTPLMVVIVLLLNYTQPVDENMQMGPHENCCLTICRPTFSCSFYWISLVVYGIETLAKLFIVTIDIAYASAPVIERPLSQETPKGYAILLSSFRLAFHTRLFLFFWNKAFHGDRDLFSEPCAKLEGDNVPSCAQQENVNTGDTGEVLGEETSQEETAQKEILQEKISQKETSQGETSQKDSQ